MSALSFELPRHLEAAAPPAVRDAVRLMVAQPGRPLVHTDFLALPEHLAPGDLLVVNESATLPAALEATREDGEHVQLHLSTPEPHGSADRWTVAGRSSPFGRCTTWVFRGAVAPRPKIPGRGRAPS